MCTIGGERQGQLKDAAAAAAEPAASVRQFRLFLFVLPVGGDAASKQTRFSPNEPKTIDFIPKSIGFTLKMVESILK